LLCFVFSSFVFLDLFHLRPSFFPFVIMTRSSFVPRLIELLNMDFATFTEANLRTRLRLWRKPELLVFCQDRELPLPPQAMVAAAIDIIVAADLLSPPLPVTAAIPDVPMVPDVLMVPAGTAPEDSTSVAVEPAVEPAVAQPAPVILPPAPPGAPITLSNYRSPMQVSSTAERPRGLALPLLLEGGQFPTQSERKRAGMVVPEVKP
jgi:hypothetical protein